MVHIFNKLATVVLILKHFRRISQGNENTAVKKQLIFMENKINSWSGF